MILNSTVFTFSFDTSQIFAKYPCCNYRLTNGIS